MREPRLFVQEDGRGLGIRTNLAGGGTEGVGGLQGMASLNPSTAAGAPADVNIKLADDGLAGNLGLELFLEVVFAFDDVAVAVRTGVGEVGFQSLVDLIGGGGAAIGVSAAVVGFAARSLGLGLGFTLTEGCGLSLGLALGFFELLGEVFDPPGLLFDGPVPFGEL